MVTSKLGHRSLHMLPLGQYPPVSIGELPVHTYQVSAETITEEVAACLERSPEIPGVVLIKDGGLHSMIPRNQMFERLGHRYGVELFLRKPIVELQENLKTETCVVSSNIGINEAANIALKRESQNAYDPLVMECDDENGVVFRMLDMRVLLRAQALVLENSNNIISNLNRIEKSIKAEIPLDSALDMIMDAVKRVAPYHRASILVKPDHWGKLHSHHPVLYRLDENLLEHQIIQSVFQTRRHVYIEDARNVAHWRGMDRLGRARTWLGSPIRERNFDGILSLGRATPSPFSANEIDMVNTFSDFIGVAMGRSKNDGEFMDMMKRKFMQN